MSCYPYKISKSPLPPPSPKKKTLAPNSNRVAIWIGIPKYFSKRPKFLSPQPKYVNPTHGFLKIDYSGDRGQMHLERHFLARLLIAYIITFDSGRRHHGRRGQPHLSSCHVTWATSHEEDGASKI
jgi:hypothetical protein